MISLADKLRAQRDAAAQVEVQEQAAAATAALVPGSALVPRRAEPVGMLEQLRLQKEEQFRHEDPHAYGEIRRICDLPIVEPLAPEEIDAVSRRWVLDAAYRDPLVPFRLMQEQADAILAYEMWGANFDPISVGKGKTLLTLMLAEAAMQRGARRVLLLVPAQVYPQLVIRDIPWARTKVRLTYQAMLLGGVTASQRLLRARCGRRGLYILPYSCLSTRDSEEVLRAIDPQVVIADEAHYLKNDRAARTARVERLLYDKVSGHKRRNEVQFIPLSGTITTKGVMDYHHLLRAALGDSCPLPLSPVTAREWGAVIDSNCVGGAFTGPIEPLVAWARRMRPSEEIPAGTAGFRAAYRLRLRTTPGVVISGEEEVACSLVMCNQPIPEPETRPGWDKLEELIRKVDEEWLTPNGDEIEHAIHTFKWKQELAAGFYNELYWPEPATLQEERGISQEEAKDLLRRAKEHHAAEQVYAKLLRGWLKDHGREQLDTPMLVGANMKRRGAEDVGEELYGAWTYARSLDFDGRPERRERAIRVCDFRVRHGLEWARKVSKDGDGGILWGYHQEVVRWATELLRQEGLDPLYCPAGDASNRAIIDPKNSKRIVVASISAHSTGKNLQTLFSRELVLQWPRPAKDAEQLVGRLHRTGQKADEILVWRCDTLEFDEMLFAACANDALYAQQTTGARQRIIYAAYDPMPKMFRPEILRERGFQNRILDGAQRKMMAERFGEPGKPY